MLKTFVKDISLWWKSVPTIRIHCDNQAMMVRIEIFCIMVTEENSVLYCSSESKIADIFTNALPKVRFEYLR